MIFQYDGVDVSSLWTLSRVWSSVEVSMQSKDREFSMEITYGMNDHQRSPDTETGLQHIYNFYHRFVYTIHFILDTLGTISVDSSKYIKSIKINPIGQQFVKVCYRGSKPTAVFTITAKESSKNYYYYYIAYIAIYSCSV